MFAKTATGVVVGILAAALIFVGVSFAGFAIFKALEHSVGIPGAAALTALIFLFVPLLFVLVASFRRPPRTDLAGEALIMNVFSGLARDKPLLAMLGAGLVGAAGIFLRRRR